MGLIGDFISQYCIENKKYDKKRGIVVGSYGGVEVGFEAKLWLPILDKVFGSQMNVVNALKKMMCDQIVYSPLERGVFMVWTNKLEQHQESIKEKILRDYALVLGSSIFYWLPLSFINYYFIPLQYRALYFSFTSLIIDIFNSFASHNNLNECFEKYLPHFHGK
jgi:protein Mpv17